MTYWIHPRSVLVSAESYLAGLLAAAGVFAHTPGYAQVWEMSASGTWTALSLGETEPYTELAYIEGSSDCFIDTGVTPGSGTSVEFDGVLTFDADASGSQAIFGAYTVNGSGATADQYMLTAQRNADTVRIYARNKYPAAVSAGVVVSGVRHTYGYRNDSLSRAFIDGAQVVTASPGEFTAGCTLYLFGANYNGTLNYVGDTTTIRCYGAKVWQSGTLVRNFVPRYATAVSKAGLYDAENDVFYPSAGPGSFVYA